MNVRIMFIFNGEALQDLWTDNAVVPRVGDTYRHSVEGPPYRVFDVEWSYHEGLTLVSVKVTPLYGQ